MNTIHTAEEHCHVPARLLAHTIFARKLFLTKTAFIYVSITENYEFYELLNKNILDKIDLREYLCELQTPRPLIDINLKIYFRYGNDVAMVNEFHLLQIDNKLVVIKRGNLEVIEVHNSVVATRIVLKDSVPCVQIEFSNESAKETFITNFDRSPYDGDAFEECASEQSVVLKNFFSDSMTLLENKIKNILAEVHVYEELTRKSGLDELCEMRFGHDEVLSEFPDEKIPLIKYGDTWTKIHNDKLIIGIPILNCTYSRYQKECLQSELKKFSGFTLIHSFWDFKCLDLFNIQPILMNSTQSYTYNIFTLANDAYEFNNQLENFTQLQSPQLTTNFDNINEDWILCKDNILESGRSGIVIIKQNLTDFQHPIAYQTFLLYKFIYETKTYTQQIFCGPIKIDPEMLYRRDSVVQMNTNELYKDFLTIISTSILESFTIKIERNQLREFLATKLKFNTIAECGIFFRNDFYWANTLVRYDDGVPDPNGCNFKIYARTQHQINTFIRCLVHELGDRCEIKRAENFYKNFNLHKNLLNEIGIKIEHLKTSAASMDKLIELFMLEMITEMN